MPIEVPAGIEDGMRIRLDGKGDAPFEGKGKAGDLYVRVAVGTSKVFRRQGANLYHDKTVPFHIAALGDTITIPTLDETVSVRVPSGTQQGEEMVLRGRGVRKLQSSQRGDLTIKFTVAVPRCVWLHFMRGVGTYASHRSLTALQRTALEQYRDALEGKTTSRPAARAASTTASPSQPSPSSTASTPPRPPPPSSSSTTEGELPL